jgi:hypothetical protein
MKDFLVIVQSHYIHQRMIFNSLNPEKYVCIPDSYRG